MNADLLCVFPGFAQVQAVIEAVPVRWHWVRPVNTLTGGPGEAMTSRQIVAHSRCCGVSCMLVIWDWTRLHAAATLVKLGAHPDGSGVAAVAALDQVALKEPSLKTS